MHGIIHSRQGKEEKADYIKVTPVVETALNYIQTKEELKEGQAFLHH